ncbi:hypothetical protein ACO1KB_08195 [Leptospira interrogans serovar Szwajizak]|uniref:hypothetical protein n=1 Tax=Leptospira interrogans TaxID=173 RepID=UPI000347CA81
MWELIQIPIRKNEYLKIRNVTKPVGTTTNLDFTVKITKTPRFLERRILDCKNKCRNSYFF